MANWREDLSKSTADFLRVVAPIIEDWTGGEIQPVEGKTDDDLAQQLDRVAGVDSWNVELGNNLIRGLASRVQWPGKSYDSFTVRYYRRSGVETEYQKRLRAIRDDGLYPHWTSQAYLDEKGGNLLAVGLVRTKDLYKHIEGGEEGKDYYIQTVPRRSDNPQAKFYVVKWDYLRYHTTVGPRTHHSNVRSKDDRTANSDFSQQNLGAWTDGGFYE